MATARAGWKEKISMNKSNFRCDKPTRQTPRLTLALTEKVIGVAVAAKVSKAQLID